MNHHDTVVNGLFFENLTLQSRLNIDQKGSYIISIGRAGGLALIKLAFDIFQNSGHDYILAGGVDTFYDKDTLDYFADSWRLLSEGSMDGFVPGEAAGFLLLTKQKYSGSLLYL